MKLKFFRFRIYGYHCRDRLKTLIGIETEFARYQRNTHSGRRDRLKTLIGIETRASSATGATAHSRDRLKTLIGIETATPLFAPLLRPFVAIGLKPL